MSLRLLIACMCFSFTCVLAHAAPLDPHTTTLPVYWLPAEREGGWQLGEVAGHSTRGERRAVQVE